MDRDTEGSEFIKQILLDDNPAPIYLQVWGGTNTIARALKSIEIEFKNTDEWSAVYKKVCDKAIIYTILDQDATYRKYIAVHWNDIKIYYNSNQFWCFAYPWKQAVPDAWHHYLEGSFMGQHIINEHGPLTKMYYSYGDGQKQDGDDEHIHGDPSRLKNAQWGDFGKYDFISEGDSPAYLHLMDVGLGNLKNPEYGGWGGRLVPSIEQSGRWEDGVLAADYNPHTNELDRTFPQTRWIPAIQSDFAARADWCIKNYEDANHAPVVELKHKMELTAKPNKKLKLKASATDPDGDTLTYRWWQYKEAGTYQGTVEIKKNNTLKAVCQVPVDIKKGETIHVILEVTDNGEHPMTRYQRAILTY